MTRWMQAGLVAVTLSLIIAAVPLGHAAKPGSETGDYRTWSEVDVSQWSPRSGDSILEVISPAIGGHPESTEGQPLLRLEVSKAESGDFMIARVTMTGYLDDSVGGEQIVAEIVQGTGGWTVQRAFQRWKCGRGPRAGNWSIKPCP